MGSGGAVAQDVADFVVEKLFFIKISCQWDKYDTIGGDFFAYKRKNKTQNKDNNCSKLS
ncbi:hypothetical protein XCR1_1680001 [Xenorhabdus cabanillasii JM26]|uniref:Uncharacterized protein n=1 Tax=Xenorhabdus cabanillasii JM26 TaxID=1427517 RepID=W1IY06_9GAMM|nr:hypothetical protein XCR1_1680001 [Xenorhabdus cabanillasii JM26]